MNERLLSVKAEAPHFNHVLKKRAIIQKLMELTVGDGEE